MNNQTRVLPVAAAAAAGALFMYYLDSASGARRRALVRDKLAAGGREAAQQARKTGKHAIDRVKGVVAGRRSGEPESDDQLHDRIRSRLGHVLSHPEAVHVDVAVGEVCLNGDVLENERDRLLAAVNAIPGVKALRCELTGHQTAETLPHAAAHPMSSSETQEHAHDAWNEQGL